MATTFLKSLLSKLQAKQSERREDRHHAKLVKSFKTDQEKEAAFDYKNRGIHRVPIDQIVGSVGRYNDFDSKFRPKHHVPSDRLQNVRKAMKSNKRLPPIKLYQIKDEYYVLDGNHRVAAAKEFGYDEVDASIIEFIPSKNTLENILYREKTAFIEKTELTVSIPLTEIGQYERILQQIQKHQRFLETETPGAVQFKSVAADWYRTVYRPLTGIIEKGRLLEFFPNRTVADLYAYISVHQWEEGRKREYGREIDQVILTSMEAFRKKMSNLNEEEYPEMLRGITAFVLMNVKAKSEYRIMDKLFSLEEVHEIHSVHGDADLLVKVVLTRDLLSSDAEIIGDFVHNKIRSLQGIISTQTLIPGVSKVKGR
jgi:Lrp/AsnC ligand binding domain/ParB/Sulfiredoxin domain